MSSPQQRTSLFDTTHPHAVKQQSGTQTALQHRFKKERRKYKLQLFASWFRFFATFKVAVPQPIPAKHRRATTQVHNLDKLKVAIVADWLTNMGGAERVTWSLHKAFPNAPIYTSVFEPDKMPLFKGLDIRTTYLQRLPRFLRVKHQLFPVLRDRAFRHLNLDEYDVIISSSSAEAKAIVTPVGTNHICYCHTPIRYYWSHYDEYLQHPGFGPLDPLIKLVMPFFVRHMRKADLRAVQGVDHFIANSVEVQKRIKKYYHRDSTVIFPPVETERLTVGTEPKEDFYLIVGRQIPYKRTDLAIQACNKLGRRLVIIGNGSEHQKLQALAGPTIEFKTKVDDQEVVRYFQQAKALLWPQKEDFGVTAVEAMAAGTPVIAYQAGGALDFVKPKQTGLFFAEQSAESLAKAIEAADKITFDRKILRKHAEQFSEEYFIAEIRAFATKTSSIIPSQKA